MPVNTKLNILQRTQCNTRSRVCLGYNTKLFNTQNQEMRSILKGNDNLQMPTSRQFRCWEYQIRVFFFINLFIYYLFIYFWLCWVFIAARGFSLVAVSRGYSLLWCAGFLLPWFLLLWSTGSRCTGFSSCSTQAQ